jgi:hypothetical protein
VNPSSHGAARNAAALPIFPNWTIALIHPVPLMTNSAI